jgi:hypothetical protein
MNRINISLSAKVAIHLVLSMITIFGVIGFKNYRMPRACNGQERKTGIGLSSSDGRFLNLLNFLNPLRGHLAR